MFGVGTAALKGQVINLLEVGNIVRRVPDVAWETQCLRCGTTQIVRHSALVYGSAWCRAAHCGKTPIKPSTHAPTPPIYECVRSADSASARQQVQRQGQPTAVDIEIARYEQEKAAQRAKDDAQWAAQVERQRADHRRFVRYQVLEHDKTINDLPDFSEWLRYGDAGQQRLLRQIEENKNE